MFCFCLFAFSFLVFILYIKVCNKSLKRHLSGGDLQRIVFVLKFVVITYLKQLSVGELHFPPTDQAGISVIWLDLRNDTRYELN